MWVIKKILRESLVILIVASILSTIGGIGLEALKTKFIFLIPLLILIPALNDAIGDFGVIISSKFTTILYSGKLNKKKWWQSLELSNEFKTISTVALFMAFYLAVLSIFFAVLQGAKINIIECLKIVAVSYMLMASLVLIIFFLAVIFGIWVYKRKEDPNNFLIPITTAIADICSLLLFSAFLTFLF
ncbi:MAG: magnesium transporter [Candidatus Nanoarchaeia archaeon]